MSKTKHAERNRVIFICSTIILLAGFPSFTLANGSSFAAIAAEQDMLYTELESRATDIWGADNVWLPSPKQWVRYESDLGERSIVDFETGEVNVQILISAGDEPDRPLVFAHLRQGVSNLILGEPSDPLEIMEQVISMEKDGIILEESLKKSPYDRQVRVYLVQRGDSLWKIARRFRMSVEELIALNEIAADTPISVGHQLKVKVFVSHDPRIFWVYRLRQNRLEMLS